jgi:putative ATP-dependent endonuclease of the OLD family
MGTIGVPLAHPSQEIVEPVPIQGRLSDAARIEIGHCDTIDKLEHDGPPQLGGSRTFSRRFSCRPIFHALPLARCQNPYFIARPIRVEELPLKLVSVTVENFRSITAARKIPLSGLTTLVGPNNEGKSNILRALVFAMVHLTGGGSQFRVRDVRQFRPAGWRARESMRYHWSNDCPLKLQKSGDSGSKITLEFELTDKDILDFRTEIGSTLNRTLPLTVLFAKTSVIVSIAKPGRGGKSLNAKSARIAQFLASKIDVLYIPAVRTAGSAVQIVEELVAGELAKIESDPKYQQALADISALQQPVLEALSKSITTTMREFLPNIKHARIVIPEQDRSFALRGISSISLDDGVETDIGVKGDGVQSLAALALMRHSSLTRNVGKENLIALEEPESHLRGYPATS